MKEHYDNFGENGAATYVAPQSSTRYVAPNLYKKPVDLSTPESRAIEHRTNNPDTVRAGKDEAVQQKYKQLRNEGKSAYQAGIQANDQVREEYKTTPALFNNPRYQSLNEAVDFSMLATPVVGVAGKTAEATYFAAKPTMNSIANVLTKGKSGRKLGEKLAKDYVNMTDSGVI